jgi:hypothetical protein
MPTTKRPHLAKPADCVELLESKHSYALAIQLADGGPSVTPAGVAGPPFRGGASGSAGFLFFGSLAVNSKMLSRANHGADDANMPAMSIPHTPVAITMMRRVILIADTSCLTVLLQNTICHPVTEVYRDHALHSSTCRLFCDGQSFIQDRAFQVPLRCKLLITSLIRVDLHPAGSYIPSRHLPVLRRRAAEDGPLPLCVSCSLSTGPSKVMQSALIGPGRSPVRGG